MIRVFCCLCSTFLSPLCSLCGILYIRMSEKDGFLVDSRCFQDELSARCLVLCFLRRTNNVLLMVVCVFLFSIGKSIYCKCVKDAYI